MTIEHCIDLARHPSSRADPVHAIQVRIQRAASGELGLTFRLDGDISRILVPAPGAPRIGKELWRHTCCEAFIAIEGQAAYHEVNLAPSGEWTVYALRGYRDGASLADATMNPAIAVRAARDRLELDAVIRLGRLAASYPRAALRVGLAAVIETREGLSYWALRHPIDRADFHNAESFALV